MEGEFMIGRPLKIREFIDEIDGGQVLLPEIQRGYVWKGPQAAKLIDSLYREYPIGQVLLWDPKGLPLPVTKRLRGAKAAALPYAGAPKVVLDGQQRLTSVYMALGDYDEQLNVYFNVATESFQLHLKSKMKNEPRWVSVRDVVSGKKDISDLLEAIETSGGPSPKSPEGRVYSKRLQRLEQIERYQIPIEIFASDDYDTVTDLFVRLNQGGTRLREAELALAQLALRLPGAIADKFEVAMDSYARLDYDLDTRFLIRALIAIGTQQSRFRFLGTFWERPATELDALWRRTKAAVDSVVNFTRKNARFESSDWLPTTNALIPLAVYFDRYQKMRPDDQGVLRWFYLASLRGRYSASAETAMDEDIKAALGDDPIDALIKNLGPASKFGVEADEFDDAGRMNPLFALTYAVARRNGAKDWLHGITIGKDSVGEADRVEIHHVFPKKVLKDLKVAKKDRDEIANLAFLARKPNEFISSNPPDKYLPEIAAKHPERLEAQYIPLNPKLWSPDRFHDFLIERRRLLAAAVNDLVAAPD
jgi:hypothetical protein